MKLNKITFVIFVFLVPLSANSGLETISSMDNKRVAAVKLNGLIMINDGILDEKVWESGEWFGGFHQRNPDEGKPATFKTEFKIVYDDKYLYIGARAYDPEPEKIIAILSRRDEYTESDWLYVSLDSYNDNRTAFEFGISAAGVLHDVRRYDDNNMDSDWDANWEGKAHIGEKSWTAEWRIPFSELRFTTSAEMEWGIQVYREMPRFDNELSVWNWWSNSEQGFVSRYGALNGLKNINAVNPVIVNPYVASQANISENLVSDVHADNYDILGNGGVEIRYSTPRGMTFTGTFNPDFGQVESDPANFNLTQFETYFSEKRPFFMEGANIFQFPLGFGDGGMGSNTLFYSRRIGRAPQGYSNYADNKTNIATESPDLTKILGAGKITSKSTGGLTIGILNAVTAEEQSTIFYDDMSRDHSVVEPLTNYMVSRVQQDFNDGQTTIGGIFTAVNRRLDGTGIDYLHSEAYTAGLDLNIEFLDRKYGFEGSLAYSNVLGDTAAIQQTQLSSARYFQRPDADHLNYNPQATSLSGYSLKGVFSKNEGNIRGAAGVIGYSPGFEINDLGYLRTVDDISQFTWVQYRQWDKTRFFRNYRINFNQWGGWDYAGISKGVGGNVNAWSTLHNSWNLGGGIGLNSGGMAPGFNRGGPALRTPSNTSLWANFNTDRRKVLSFAVSGNYFKNGDGETGFGLSPALTWRARQNLQLSTRVGFNKFDGTWAWVAEAEDEFGEKQYIWSGIEQTTVNITFRADWTINNELTIQYYAQPYLTAGRYFDFLELSDPKAKKFDKRFSALGESITWNDEEGVYAVDRNMDGIEEYSFEGDADYNFKQFRSNLVLRWEYMTGSVLYLVWSQGFTDYEAFKPFAFSKDLNTLFGSDVDNTLMIKISYNLNL